MLQFTSEHLPHPEEFGSYAKKTETLASRIHEPFTVVTAQGELYCDDGFLAVDTDGNPYPIPATVFEENYEMMLEDPTDPVEEESSTPGTTAGPFQSSKGAIPENKKPVAGKPGDPFERG